MIYYLEWAKEYDGGFVEQLTTPEIKNFDVALPGENWFFYWKTSPSLWEAKLNTYQGSTPLLVPIYWALHNSSPENFDFGQQKPETDLLRLAQTAQNCGKEIVFLLPISPAPFLTNGGIPSYLARNLAKNKDGIALAVIDNQSHINKVYSFFEPKCFQSYRKFVWKLGQYLSQGGNQCAVYGLECMRLEENHVVSYFKDHSQVFESGFNRYIKQLQDSEPQKVKRLVVEPEYENDLKLEYYEIILGLYLDSAKEFLAGNWSGVLQSCLIGGSSEDILKRSFENWGHEQDYFEPLMQCLANDVYPFTPLLDPNIRKGTLAKAFSDVIDTNLVQSHLEEGFYSDEGSLAFSPLVLFQLCGGGNGFFSFDRAMEDAGLKYFFEKRYPWTFKIKNDFFDQIDDLDERPVYFFFGSKLDEQQFKSILKLFMNGHKVFLDKTDLDSNLDQKLAVFCAENNLETQKINYISPVTKISLGDGLIITYESKKLHNASLLKRTDFWENMIDYLEVKHLDIDAQEGVFHFWKTRSSNSYELNYEEIRRAYLYNPTSYKKKVQIRTGSNFAFLKKIDEKNVNSKSTPMGVDILLLPGGSITLDFGFFE